MTKNLTGFLVIFFLMAGSLLSKNIINVAPGDGTLRKAIAGAAPGDILELQGGGIYSESRNVPFRITKKITIRTEKNAVERPVIRWMTTAITRTDGSDMFILGAGADLTMSFLEFKGVNGELESSSSLQDFISFSPGSDYHAGSVTIEKCVIHGFRGKIVNGANSLFDGKNVVLDSLLINETKIYNAENGFNFKYVGLEYLKLKNSTLWKIDSKAIRIQNSDPVVVINHCNFDRIGREGRIIDAKDLKNNWLIKNCIFSNQLDPRGEVLRVSSAAILLNCNFWKVGKIKTGGAVVADTLRENPGYLDADNGNFELSPASPLLSRAKYKRALGDIRWDPNQCEMHNRNLVVDLLYPRDKDPLDPVSEISVIMGQGILAALTQSQFPGRSLFASKHDLERKRYLPGRWSGRYHASRIYFYELSGKSYSDRGKTILLA